MHRALLFSSILSPGREYAQPTRPRNLRAFLSSLPIKTPAPDTFSVLAVIVFRDMDQAKPAALLQLFDEHHLPLFRFAYRLTRSVADAEDILQECFLGLLRSESNFDPSRTALINYLFGAVRNQALKRVRMRGLTSTETESPSNAGSPEMQAAQTELGTAVDRAIALLPEAQREVLILSHYEQLSQAEIAGICGIEVSAVKSRLQRARAALKEMLATHAPGVERNVEGKR